MTIESEPQVASTPPEPAAPHPPTLRALFDATDIDAHRLERVLNRRSRPIAEAAGLARADIAQRLAPAALDALRAALDIALADVMARAWLPLPELREAAQLSASGRPYLAPLARHRLVSEHAPGLEIAYDGEPIERIAARASVSFSIEAMEIVMRDGAIAAIRNGFYSGAGSLSLDGVGLAVLPTRAYAVGAETPLRRPLRPPH